MKKIIRYGLFFSVLILFSCDLFQLQPVPRENPKDPGSDSAVLYVVSVSPADGAEEVETDAVILVTFSESIDQTTVTADTFTVTAEGSAIDGTFSVAEEEVTFTPSEDLTPETEYTLTLTVGIHNLDGTGMEAPVNSDFNSRNRRWEAPVLLETDDAGIAQKPQIAVDQDGNAIAVWIQDDATYFNILSSRYTPGDGWSAAELIETDNNGHAFEPQVAIDAAGNAVAVWSQYDASVTKNIWANRYTAGDGWGTAEKIEDDDTGNAQTPQVAVDPSGNAVAVWRQDDGTRYNIWANRYTAGSGWGDTPEKIENDDTNDTETPQVAADPNGNALAVWSQFEDVGLGEYKWNIRANRYSATSGWATSAVLLETDNAGQADEPQIAVDTAGNAIAVWRQNGSIYSNRYTVGTGWRLTAEIIEDSTGGYCTEPQIALDTAGNAMVVWSQYDDIRYNIWANRYTVGSGWGTEELIETDDAGNASKPQVAVDADGDAVVVWYQDDGTNMNIWANRYTVGSGWGTAELIETNDSGGALDPQVGIDPAGNAVAVWQIQKGYAQPYDIYAAHYR